ncbi:MAG: acyltransferase [Bacteroidales bacterium]|nr:acyltransferase [Bacteroidales bacterium]
MIKIFDYKSDRLHGLDHLRAIAILLVMLFHYGRGIPSWLEPVKQIGWTGVDLFFVLSGYLIGSQLLKEMQKTHTISFKRFYLKRFFRIIPAYIVVLIIYYSLPDFREGAGMPPLWRFLTFTQNLGLDAQNSNTFSHAWSLCIEEQFYLLLPLIIISIFALKLQKGTPYVVLALVILGFAFRIYNWNEYVQPFIESGNRSAKVYGFVEKIYYPSYNRMDGLLIGVSIAAVFNFKPKLKNHLIKHGNIVLLIGVALFLIAYKVCENFVSYDTAVYGFPLISLAYGVIVIAALSPSSILYRFKSKISLIIATLSYAIYLTHKLLFHLTKSLCVELGLNDTSAWTFWICIAIALLGGFVLHLIIEKPFLKLRKIILNKLGQSYLVSSQNLIVNYLKSKVNAKN